MATVKGEKVSLYAYDPVAAEWIPVIQDPATESPVVNYGTVSTSSSSNQLVLSWTVTTGKVGILREVEIMTDDYTIATWTLVIGATTVIGVKKFPTAVDIPFPDLRIPAGTTVALYVQSDGSTTINAYGVFGAKEVG